MTEHDFGAKLKEMYENAPNGEHVLQIHLFGIKYAKEMKKNNYSAKDIVKASGIKESYGTEVDKGIKLSKYVVLKPMS